MALAGRPAFPERAVGLWSGARDAASLNPRLTMPFWPPNVAKLSAKQDVDGLRAALRYSAWEIRDSAARALGELELPPGTTQRRGIVPQEAIADLVACWDEMMARYVNAHGAIRTAPDFGVYGAAIGRIGGPAGWQALLELHARGQKGWGYWLDDRRWESMFKSAFQLFPTEELAAALLDERKPAEVRGLLRSALQLEQNSVGGAAIAEFDRRLEHAEHAYIEEHLDDLIRKHDVKKLAKSGDPRATKAVVDVLFDRRREPSVIHDAQKALISIGPAAVGPLVEQLRVTQHSYESVSSAKRLLTAILEQRAGEIAAPDLAKLCYLSDLESLVVQRDGKDEYDAWVYTHFTVPVEFGAVREAAQRELERRAEAVPAAAGGAHGRP